MRLFSLLNGRVWYLRSALFFFERERGLDGGATRGLMRWRCCMRGEHIGFS